ncbi:MAG: aminomethyltransferase beta-barrel domain-containing protein [bacterium]
MGTFPKSKIRKLAKKFNLPVSDKKESQEVCFINNEIIVDFIERYKNIKLKTGNIKNSTGEAIGIHNGIAGYTIGQRKGLGVAVGKPVFVNKIDEKLNEIFVGEAEQLYNSKFLGTDLMWFQDKGTGKKIKVNTKTRHAHRPAASEIILKDKNHVEVQFKKPQRAITPGQLAVFYQKEIVVGSAWIKRVLD